MAQFIDHINISVENLGQVKAFFLGLGFEEVADGQLSGQWLSELVGLPQASAKYVALKIPDSQTNLELIEYETPKGKRDPQGHRANQLGFRHIALRVSNIDDWVKRLSENGIRFHSEVKDYQNQKRLCYFYGPEQIIIELAEVKSIDAPVDLPKELQPIWLDAPRYFPSVELPPYRYVNGLNPHPFEDKDGHSFGNMLYQGCGGLIEDTYRDNIAYCYGIDLYNHGYVWEAHAAWESLWKQCDRHGADGRVAQAMIMLGAAYFKAHMGKALGPRHLSRRACDHLQTALLRFPERTRCVFGLDIPALLESIREYYGPLWDTSDEALVLGDTPPRLVLI